MNKVVVDCSTGEQMLVPMTAQESRSRKREMKIYSSEERVRAEAAQQALQQRKEDAVLNLNNNAFRDTKAQRDALARLIGVQPLSISPSQDATPDDIIFVE